MLSFEDGRALADQLAEMAFMGTTQTATAEMPPPVLDWAKLEALVTRLERQRLDIMLPGQSILAGADYLVVAGSNIWDLWHEREWLTLGEYMSGKFRLLNVEFRRTPYVGADKAYTIRTWREDDPFYDPWNSRRL